MVEHDLPITFGEWGQAGGKIRLSHGAPEPAMGYFVRLGHGAGIMPIGAPRKRDSGVSFRLLDPLPEALLESEQLWADCLERRIDEPSID